MRDITHKFETLRVAHARAVLTSEDSIPALLEASRADKGDALEVARVAGIMAAKKTWEAIPFCHPIPVTQAGVEYDVDEHTVRVRAWCKTVAQTGCEIEALHAASVAALTVYDLLKPHTASLRIDGIELASKSGGKSDHAFTLEPAARVAVLVANDAVAAGKKPDRAGDIAAAWVDAQPGLALAHRSVHPANADTLGGAIDAALTAGAELVLTVGGTGVGREAVAVDAVRPRLDRELPGVMEAARSYGQRRTPLAMLSSGVAGVAGGALLVTLPGSSAGAEETLHAVGVGLRKILANLRQAC